MKKKNSKECSVCGDEAAYCFYGAIVCDSCRAFFRRNVIRGKQQVKCRKLKKQKNQDTTNNYNSNNNTSSSTNNNTITNNNNNNISMTHEYNEGQCDVSVANRKFCSKCRMDKCLLVGMKKEHVFILKGSSSITDQGEEEKED